MPIPGLKTRKPTGRVPWPCILLEGEEKAGKSWALAQFSASDKIGALYWVDLNEGAADEYGAIPGADYQVVEHDGSYAAVLAAVQAVKAEARRAAGAGEPPVALGIDTGSAIWDGLKDWASDRAAKSSRNRELLKRDPNAEITISQNLWNDAGARWRKLQTELLTFPGIVVVTSRGKEVTEVDANGRPIEGQKTWSVQMHREFPYAASVWVRLRRGRRPLIVGARSVHVGIKPNDDPAREVKDPAADGRLLEWLVFDALKCDPAAAHTRDLQQFHGGELLDHERTTAPEVPAAAPAEQPAPAPQRPAQQQRPRQRAEQRPAGRTPAQWAEDVAKATTRERLLEIHAAATAAEQMTQGLLEAIRAKAETLPKPADPTLSAVAAAHAATAPEEEDGITEAERRGMLAEELAEIAKLMDWTVDQLIGRHLPRGLADAPIKHVQQAVARIRPLAVTKLRQLGRDAEADAYAKVKADECDTWANLLTDPALAPA